MHKRETDEEILARIGLDTLAATEKRRERRRLGFGAGDIAPWRTGRGRI